MHCTERSVFHDTLELRWFGSGPVPRDAEVWFSELPGALDTEPDRQDCYLRSETSPSLSVTRREGTLEIRQRLSRADTTIVAAHCAGRPECWRQWRFLLAQASDSALSDAGWLTVGTSRRVRHFQGTQAEPCAPAPGDDPAERCRVELTAIDVGGEAWWSLGFEAPAHDAPGASLLLPVAHALLNRDGAPELSAQSCCGYPQWLARL